MIANLRHDSTHSHSAAPKSRSALRMTAAPVALMFAAAMTLAACSNAGPKENVGTVGGAVAGGLAGSAIGGGTGKLVAVGVGTLLGAIVGSEIGKSLDKADRTYAAQTTQQTLETQPSGSTSNWSNPDSGHYGTVTPTTTYQRADGTYCREYQQTVTVDGRTERAHGTACRQPDGSWKIVS